MKRTATVKLYDHGITREFEIELPFYFTDMNGARVNRVEPNYENLILTSVTEKSFNQTPFRSIPVDGAITTKEQFCAMFDIFDELRGDFVINICHEVNNYELITT